MNWLILAALAGFASNGFNITNRYALKNNGDHTAYAWWFELVRTSFFLFFAIQQTHIQISFTILGQLIIIGLAELFSVYVFMRMHAHTQLSISSIISRSRIVWSPVIAWFILGERLTLVQYIAIVIIFTGLAIVSTPKQLKSDKGIRVALLFAFSSALLSVVLKLYGNVASTEMVIVSQGILPLLVLPLLMKGAKNRIIAVGKSNLLQTILGGIFNIASSYLLVESLKQSDASKVVGVYQAMTLFSVIYGIFIMKEKDKIIEKIIGSLVVLFGIILMIAK